jgi:hypothetical protein
MQKARVSFKEKTILNDRLVIENKLFSGNTLDDENASKFYLRDIGSTTGTFVMVR